MKANAGKIRLSASDVSNHLACSHLTALDLAVATGGLSAPKWHSPDAWVLQQRGMEHEKAYLSHLEAEGIAITDLREIDNDEKALGETIAAMQQGVAAIAQATLADRRWFGRADILRRVDVPSKLGGWS